ncbi:Uracil-DNA glycosylase, family 4 [Candidatus Syntrophocurvum alkaliphilum]|uniref:Type-4 uracil-DNA glycosylase n=1 Tax=Candidatus Syntrophocurvum alkaliphilum TaxID=2293317 RepID=A0A6I6DGF8_9FIRM|nr:uracil-DNA glycosylase [Candidatus Syntrophocurvum alkaliphilum]QGT98749.1 Uracil-DNA glycosylase, family 4 [Candidatus Syntrophocurvum alkaliphilum]
MSKEQPNLFFDTDSKNEKNNSEMNETIAYTPFLPSIKSHEAFLDINSYDELKKIANKCENCGLRKGCKQVVFGDGNNKSDIMFIGEGPGQDEDNQGIPFVGPAGQLLDRILNAAEINREAVYITNVVKCRPPSNRLPNPEEVKVCRGYLEAQIRIINPKIIVCLGSKATQVVINSKARITKMRGQWILRNGIKIIATFHPAALLRNEEYKRPTWEDFKKIRDEYKSLG